MNCKTLLDNYVDDDTYVHLEMLKYSGNNDEPDVIDEVPTVKLSEMAYADFRPFMKKEILEIVPVIETIENAAFIISTIINIPPQILLL